jgi:hypothetical protein
MAWRDQTGIHEERYLQQAPGIETRSWWDDLHDDEARPRWWLGPEGREWLESWLADGWLGLSHVHRTERMTHAVVVLDASERDVLLMDPIFGHIVEPWDWFLGIGLGSYGCHRICSWHRKEVPDRGPFPATLES